MPRRGSCGANPPPGQDDVVTAPGDDTITPDDPKQTVNLTITVNWDNDSDNYYNTRPESDDPDYDWQVDFLIQYQDEGEEKYTTVTTEDGEPRIVKLYGKGESSSTTVNLPYVENRQYYAFELNPWYKDSEEPPEHFKVVSSEDIPEDYLDGWYDAIDKHELEEDGNCTTTVTNTLATTQVTAKKVWVPQVEGANYPTVTVKLYFVEERDSDDNPIFEDGNLVDTATLSAENSWMYTWENLPLYHPDDKTTSTGTGGLSSTRYRVVEEEGDGYVQVGETTVGQEEGYDVYTFTNRLTADLTIENKVTGSGDQSKAWTFRLAANLPEEAPFVGDWVGYRNGGTEVALLFDEVDGYATFTLGGGESLEIRDFPPARNLL